MAGAAATGCGRGSFACWTSPCRAWRSRRSRRPIRWRRSRRDRPNCGWRSGFGGGEHALAQIAAHPEAALIACEVFDNGICSLLSRLVPEGDEATAPLPANLRLWTDDARTLLRLLPDACLDRLFLLFPDPWPKARHAKRRFVHPALLPLLARVLKPGAEWRVASDDPTYQAWVAEVMAAQALFDAPPPVDRAAARLAADALRGEGAARGPHAALLDVHPALTGAAVAAMPRRATLRPHRSAGASIHSCSHHAARTGNTTAPGIQSAVNSAASPCTNDGQRHAQQLLHRLVDEVEAVRDGSEPDQCASIAAPWPASPSSSPRKRRPSVRRVSAVAGMTTKLRRQTQRPDQRRQQLVDAALCSAQHQRGAEHCQCRHPDPSAPCRTRIALAMPRAKYCALFGRNARLNCHASGATACQATDVAATARNSQASARSPRRSPISSASR